MAVQGVSMAAERSQQGMFGPAAKLGSQMAAQPGDLAQLQSSHEEGWKDPSQEGRGRQHHPSVCL